MALDRHTTKQPFSRFPQQRWAWLWVPLALPGAACGQAPLSTLLAPDALGGGAPLPGGARSAQPLPMSAAAGASYRLAPAIEPETLLPSADLSQRSWQFKLTPYLWLPTDVEGRATADGVTSPLDIDLGDLFSVTDLGTALRFEAWRGKWGVILDGSLTVLDGDGKRLVRTFPLTTTTVDITQVMLNMSISYRVLDCSGRETTESAAQRPNLALELLAGARYSYLKHDVEVSFGVLRPNLGDTKDWFEPFIGGRLTWDLSDKLVVEVGGDVGGFAIGSNASNLTWNLLAAAGYRLSDSITLLIGYRIYDIDYDVGSLLRTFEYDARLSGPWLGISFEF